MNNITEKLSVALERFDELRAKFSPLDERVDMLNQKVGLVSRSVAELADEIAEVKLLTNGSANAFDLIGGILREIELESNEMCRSVAENEILRESMTSMFSEAFNVVSKFIETAKHIGIIDSNHADQILAGKPVIISATENHIPKITGTSNINNAKPNITQTASENVTEDVAENVAENDVKNIAENAVENVTENVIEDAGIVFGGVVDNENENVANNNLTAEEMASQLDLQPLQLNTATENQINESTDNIIANDEESESDAEESLEAILDDISKPISTV
ncbi:MAG: hypothetical protein LBT09_11425 [Planctomycetaceae bacterium]|jgi:hypothetical protein|nr:hypothetical protein [Planctomycetaceae bacterium]